MTHLRAFSQADFEQKTGITQPQVGHQVLVTIQTLHLLLQAAAALTAPKAAQTPHPGTGLPANPVLKQPRAHSAVQGSG